MVVVLSYLIYNNRKFLQTLCKQVVLNIPSARSLPIIGHFHKFYRLSPEGKLYKLPADLASSHSV